MALVYVEKLRALGDGVFVEFPALVALAEAFVTYSRYMTFYYNELLYFLVFAIFSAIQAAIDAVACRVPARAER